MTRNAKDNPQPAATEGCAVDPLLKFLAREWASHIVWALAREKTMRFGALRRALPGNVSARLLSTRLKELESHSLVMRHDTGRLPLHVEYSLTADGHRLDKALRRGEPFAARLSKRANKSDAGRKHPPGIGSQSN